MAEMERWDYPVCGARNAVFSLIARRISTAAPTPARCIRHRRRSQALPAVLAPLEFKNTVTTKKETRPRGQVSFWRRWRDLNSVGCFASFYSLPCGKLTRFQTTPTSRKKKPTQQGRFLFWRRWRDLNSRGAINTLPHFECGPFSHLGTSPYNCLLYTPIIVFVNH